MMHEQVHCHGEAANHQLPIAAAFWIIWMVSMEECTSLRQNLMQIHCSTCSVIFECNGHTVHMLTQQHLSPPLGSTVKLSSFTHAHPSPLSLAARLHWCHTNHSHYIDNGWIFLDRPCIIMLYTENIWGLSRKSLAIVNIMRMVWVTSV